MSKVLLVQGLGFGDEGKGSITEYLVRRENAPLVVRFNGGGQAAHNVVTDDGRHHTFRQFGSGTFAGARTFLSRYMLINPFTLDYEAQDLEQKGVKDPLALVTWEETALLTTPFHMAANRIREIIRGNGRHGSCGMGIGETMAGSLAYPEATLRVLDIRDPRTLSWKLRFLQDRLVKELEPQMKALFSEALIKEWDALTDVSFVDTIVARFTEVYSKVQVVDDTWLPKQLYESAGSFIFEGAQGMLLDQDWGFHPYTTWTDCTFGNARKLIAGITANVYRIGVLRAYSTRHGAGPFPTEDREFVVPKSEHNTYSEWQRDFRAGPFDLVLTKYARRLLALDNLGVEHLAITCLDHVVDHPIRLCREYTTNVGIERAKNGLSQSRYEMLGIDFREPHSLQRQENMGRILGHMKPIYEELPNIDSFINRLERELTMDVTICSYGPKASDKREK